MDVYIVFAPMFLVPKHSNTIIIVLLSIVLIYSLGLCLQIKYKQFICCELFSVVKIVKELWAQRNGNKYFSILLSIKI